MTLFGPGDGRETGAMTTPSTHSSPTTRPIVVAVDGSSDGTRALDYAATLASPGGHPLRLVHVAHETIPFAVMLPLLASAGADEVGKRILESARRHVFDLDEKLDVDTVLVRGPRADSILDHASDAVAIVLGTRRPSLHRVITGSTTTAVAAKADCPVYCIPASWSPDRTSHRVIAGVDGSTSSHQVLDRAYAEADQRGATLTVVHAWRPSDIYDHAIGTHQIETDWETAARRNLTEIVAGRSQHFPDLKVDLDLQYDWPATALEHSTKDADLVVLGQRGHGGPLGLAIGSTARALLRTGHCPVEIIPVEDEPAH